MFSGAASVVDSLQTVSPITKADKVTVVQSDTSMSRDVLIGVTVSVCLTTLIVIAIVAALCVWKVKKQVNNITYCVFKTEQLSRVIQKLASRFHLTQRFPEHNIWRLFAFTRVPHREDNFMGKPSLFNITN